MPRDASLSDSKCWNGGHEWVKLALCFKPTSPSDSLSNVIPSYPSLFFLHWPTHTRCPKKRTWFWLLITASDFKIQTLTSKHSKKEFLHFLFDVLFRPFRETCFFLQFLQPVLIPHVDHGGWLFKSFWHAQSHKTHLCNRPFSLKKNTKCCLTAYLKGRIARCWYNFTLSPSSHDRVRTPHGSCISPSLFNFFVLTYSQSNQLANSYLDDFTDIFTQIIHLFL